MDVRRRNFLSVGTRIAAGALAAPALTHLAHAQIYPSRPVRMLVGFPAGNAPDIMARLLGQALSERLGQQFIIDNRPGAASNIAVEAAVNAPADGYTLLMVVLTNVFNATLYPSLRFNVLRDIAPVAGIADAPYLMMINPSVPAKTVPEFVAYAKANPGKINMASGGNGSASHVFGELLKMLAAVDMVHIPYRANFMPDLISGQVQVVFAPMPQAIDFYRNGQLRALGVSTAKRHPRLPELPTIGEAVPGYEALGWYGLGAPKDTPREIVTQLNAAVNAALADDALKSRLVAMGVDPLPMSPAAFGTFLATDVEKWARVIRAGGIKAE
jgi:tripartite-type tricarboxylate transporter receptor subunit TctC